MNNIYFPKINLIAILITGVCLIPAKSNAQFDCDSYNQSPAKENIMHEYSYTNIGNNYNIIQGQKLFTFINEKKEVYLVNLVLEKLYIQKYDENLQFLVSSTITISMDKSRSYLQVIQLSNRLYVLYIDKTGTGNGRNQSSILAQEIDGSTLKLNEQSINLLDGDIEFESTKPTTGVTPIIKTNIYLSVSENNKYISLLLIPKQNRDLAAVYYKVLSDELTMVSSGGFNIDFSLNDVKSVATIVSNTGAFAAGMEVEKSKKIGSTNYFTIYIYTTDKQNKLHTNVLENEQGYSRNFKIFAAADQLFVDLEWHDYAEKKAVKYSKKIFVIDFQSGDKITEVSNMPFDYLSEVEKLNFGGFKFDDYNLINFSFELNSILQDKKGNLYLCYIESTPIILKGSSFAVKIYLKLDQNYDAVWAHMFYFSYYGSCNLAIVEDIAHAFGLSHSKINSAMTTERGIAFNEHKDAAKEEYLYDITFSEDGQFEIKEFVPKCNDSFQKLNLITGGYFPEHNTFLYYGFTEEKDHPGYLVKFNY